MKTQKRAAEIAGELYAKTLTDEQVKMLCSNSVFHSIEEGRRWIAFSFETAVNSTLAQNAKTQHWQSRK